MDKYEAARLTHEVTQVRNELHTRLMADTVTVPFLAGRLLDVLNLIEHVVAKTLDKE